MTSFQGLYSTRAGVEGDHHLIYATFLRGLYYGDSWFSLIPKDIFMANYKLYIQALINSPSVVITIACLPDDPDVILGYSILSADYQTVVWVYVKSAWRKKGIGRALVPQHPTYVSHLTEVGKSLLSKINNPLFNPFFPKGENNVQVL